MNPLGGAACLASMSQSRIAQVFRRTPGEVAFDRCFFPLASLSVVGVVTSALTAVLSLPAHPRTEAELASEVPNPAWPLWILFSIGLVVAFFWLRAFIGVVQVWRDPSARILRYPALGLLLPLGFVAVRLLLLPFL